MQVLQQHQEKTKNDQQQEPELKGEGSLYKITLHDHRGIAADLVSYRRAASITRASDTIWAAIPKDDQWNWSTTVERAD